MNRSDFDGSIQRAQPPAQEVNVIVEISILHFAGGPPYIAQNYFAVQCPAGISEKYSRREDSFLERETDAF